MTPNTQVPIEQRTKLATSTPQSKSDFERLLEKDAKFIEYIPFGEETPVRLTVQLVQQLLCERTKGNRICSDNDAKKFIVMCKSMRLNPFEKDAFIAGYDTKQPDGTYAGKFSIIIAHQAYLKRAEASPDFKGMESGIILRSEDGQLIERETDFVMPEETKLVVGGWAKVHRANRLTTYRRCSVAARRPDYDSRFWSDDKTPEMICKCAESDALRSTFPTLLGGLSGEVLDVTDRFLRGKPSSVGSGLVETVPAAAAPEPKPEPAPELDQDGDLGPQPKADLAPKAPTAKEELEALVESAGCTFQHLQTWGMETGRLDGADSLANFSDISDANAKRLLRIKSVLLAGLEEVKGRTK